VCASEWTSALKNELDVNERILMTVAESATEVTVSCCGVESDIGVGAEVYGTANFLSSIINAPELKQPT
jgi:hypothetical protein